MLLFSFLKANMSVAVQSSCTKCSPRLVPRQFSEAFALTSCRANISSFILLETGQGVWGMAQTHNLLKEGQAGWPLELKHDCEHISFSLLHVLKLKDFEFDFWFETFGQKNPEFLEKKIIFERTKNPNFCHVPVTNPQSCHGGLWHKLWPTI